MNNDEVFRRLRALKPRFSEMKIKRMAVFGSYARGEERSDSDVDILIEPSSDVFTLFDMSDIKCDLEKKLGLRVDVLTFDGIHPRLKSRILSEAKDV